MRLISALKPWQRFTLIVLLILAVGGTYGVYSVLTTTDSFELEGDQQLIPVQLGDLVNTVSVSGSVSFPDSESMSFGTAGTVADIFVQEGERVQAGAPLATLDDQTIENLKGEVVQARIDVRDAQDALNEFRTPSDLTLAQASQEVVESERALLAAEEALDELVRPSEVKIARARSAVSAAQVDLDNANEKLEDFSAPPSELELATARANVADAELGLKNILEEISDMRAGVSDEDIADAQDDIDAAATALGNARADVFVVGRELEVEVSQAEERLGEASEAYADTFQAWLGIEVDETRLGPDFDSQLESFGVDLERLFDRDNRVQSPYFYTDGPLRDDPLTEWDEVTLYVWLNLTPIPIEGTCDPGDPPRTGKCVEEEFRTASSVFEDAVDAYASTLNRQANGLNDVQNKIRNSTDALRAAEDRLADLLEPIDEVAVANREAAADVAQVALKDSKDALAELESKTTFGTASEIEHQLALIAAAESALGEAKADLEELLSGTDHPDYRSRYEAVTLARLTLADKRDDLNELQSGGADELDLELLQTAVVSAQAALSDVQQRLKDSTLRAPWNGFISSVHVESGQTVEKSERLLQLVDTSVVEINGSVDEIDVLSLTLGSSAEVTMDALQDQTMSGTVALIGAEPQSEGGVVTYPVSVRLDVPPGAQIPEGLSATASVTISEELNVLLIPIQAVRGSFDRPTVNLLQVGQVTETEVVLGESDDFWTTVVSGVSEGDMVVSQFVEELDGPGGRGGPVRIRRAAR